MSKKLLRKKLALMLANLRKKRPYYVECEYLESTGTQYIDTGIIPNANTECSMHLAFVSLDSTYRTPFSVRTADGATNSFTIMSSRATNDNNSFAFGSSYWSGPSVPSVVLNKTVEAVLRKGYASWDGVSGYPGISITPTSLTAYMFARNANGTAGNFFMGKIYKCTIKDGDTLVRDFIPVLGWDGKGYMYDKVSGQLFGNAGTGDFVVGREIHYIDYLESTGTQYIDTGYKPNVNTVTEMLLDNYTFSRIESFFGVYSTDYRTNCYHCGCYENDLRAFVNGSPALTSYFGNIAQGVIFPSSISSIKLSNTALTINGTNYTYTQNPNTPLNVTSNMILFGYSNAGTFRDDRGLNGKVKSTKIWDNGVLVRDFIPAIDENGVGFMFDRVSHTCFLNQGTGSFKYPAREVEYLEADGSQFIKTGIVPNNSTGAYCVFNLNNITIQNYVLGSRGEQAGVGRFYLYNNENSTKVRYGWGSLNTTNADAIVGTKVSVSLNYKNDKKYIYNNSILVQSLADVSWSSNTYQMYLFSTNFAGNDYGSGIKGKIYEAQITQGTETIRDFIPCYKDGVACMVDKLTGTLYTNQGTGSFSTGRILEPEYE